MTFSTLPPTVRRLLLLLAFGGLAVVMTWPLARNADTHVVDAKWHYDSMVNMMILGSRMHFLLGQGALHSVYDNYFCAPVPLSIAFNENLFGLTLLYAPFYLATRDPLFSYNALLLLSLTLSGFFAYLLVKRLSGDPRAAFLMGVAYAFCPYIFFELGRIQLVSAQWIPLCALLLHDAIETGRTRSVIGLGLAYALQVGSCLYYAVFLLVYFALVGTTLMIRHKRFERSFLLRLAGAGVLVGALVAGMSYPYFEARKDFPLIRSESKAAEYSGQMSDLFSVYPQNRSLPFLHNEALGPYEPISFPGFVLITLALLSLGIATVVKMREAQGMEQRRLVLIAMMLCPIGVLAAVGATVAFRDGLMAILAFVAVVAVWRTVRREPILPPLVALYGMLLLLAVALFLGPTPISIGKVAVRGLYYYLYNYVPGFDGVRYVSRLAILIMLALIVLGGFGAAALLDKIKNGRARIAVFCALLAAMLFELRNAPVELTELPNKKRMPSAYRWLAKHPGPEPIAAVPAYPLGFFGAREDYMSLFYGRRTINGKSSWMPPITHAFISESRRFPRRSLTSMLRTLGAKYVLIHSRELSSDRTHHILSWMDSRPEDYSLRFNGDGDYVYELLPANDPNVGLLRTPEPPKGSYPLDAAQVRARASIYPQVANLALDGLPDTVWATKRQQLPGDWFELELLAPRKISAIEISEFNEPFDAPMSFRLWAEAPGQGLHEVMRRSSLRIYHDQVYHPKDFVFRVVLPEPVLTTRIRIELVDTVAGRWWSVPEVTLWATN